MGDPPTDDAVMEFGFYGISFDANHTYAQVAVPVGGTHENWMMCES